MSSTGDGTRRIWPISPSDFVDTTLCPACFAPLDSVRCSRCGLDLASPRAAALLDAGRAIVEAEEERQATIAAMRAEQAARAAEAERSTASARAAQAAETDAPARAAEAARLAAEQRLAAVVEPEASEPAWVVPSAPGAVTPVAPAVPPVPAGSAAPIAGASAAAVPGAGASAPAPLAPPAPPVAGSPAGRPASVPPSPRPTAPQPAAPQLPPAPRRKLSVQVVLLIVGVCLVGVAAIFFLTVAWFVAGLAARAAIVAGITLASGVAAVVLRRRELVATGEGIAVLTVGLLALDAWAVRANGLFGADRADPALYAGLCALGLFIVYRLWAALSSLRAPDIAAAAALPVGVGLSVLGGLNLALPGDGAGYGAVVAPLAAAVAGLAHRLPAPFSSGRLREGRPVERIVLGWSATGAALIAGVALPFAVWRDPWLPVWGGAALVVVSVLLVRSFRERDVVRVEPAVRVGTASAAGRPTAASGRMPELAVATWLLAAVAGLAASVSAWIFAVRFEVDVVTAVVPSLVAVAAALGAERLARRGRARDRVPALVGVVATGAVAALSILFLVFGALTVLADALGALEPWSGAILVPLSSLEPTALAAILTLLVVVVAVATVSPTARATPGARRASVVAVGVAAILAVPALGSPLALVLGDLALTAGALVLLARGADPALRVVLSVLAPVTVALAWTFSAVSGALWWLGAVSAVAVPLVLRLRAPRAAGAPAGESVPAPVPVAAAAGGLAGAPTPATAPAPESGAARAGWLAAATVTALLAAILAPRAIRSGETGGFTTALVDSAAAVQLLAVVALGLAALGFRGAGALERRTLALLAGGAAVLALLVPTAGLGGDLVVTFLGFGGIADPPLQPEPVSTAVRALVLVGVLAVWLRSRRLAGFTIEATAAALGIVPVAAVAVAAAVSTVDRALAGDLLGRGALDPDASRLLPSVGALAVLALVVVAAGLALLGATRRADEAATASPIAAPRSGASLRPWLEGGAGIAAVVALSDLAARDQRMLWLGLLLVAVAVVLAAVSADGLVASGSPRRHLGWLALATASGALWLRLDDGRVVDVEPYVLPPALALAVIAVLLARVEGRRGRASVAAGALLAAATLLGLLPSALVGAGAGLGARPGGAFGGAGLPFDDGPETTVRAIAAASIAAVLLLVAAFAAPTSRLSRSRLGPALGAASAVVLVLGLVGRAIASAGVRRPPVEVWTVPLLVVTVLAAIGFATGARRAAAAIAAGWTAPVGAAADVAGPAATPTGPSSASPTAPAPAPSPTAAPAPPPVIRPAFRAPLSAAPDALRDGLAAALVPVALVGAVFGELAGVVADSTGVRSIGVVVALGVLHVLALARPVAPLGALVGWLAAGSAALVSGVAVALGLVEPIEWVTVPLGAALVVGSWLAFPTRVDHVPPGQRGVRDGAWLAGLAVAGIPSAVVALDEDSAYRVALVLGLGGLVALAAAAARVHPSLQRMRLGTVWFASAVITITAFAWALGSRAPGESDRFDGFVLLSGIVLLVVAIVSTASQDVPGTVGTVGTGRFGSTPDGAGTSPIARWSVVTPPVLAAIGAGIVVVDALSRGGDSAGVVRWLVVALVSAAVTLASAAVFGSARWRTLARVGVVAGVVTLATAVDRAVLPLPDGGSGVSIVLEAWLVPAAAVAVVAAALIVRGTTRPVTAPAPATPVPADPRAPDPVAPGTAAPGLVLPGITLADLVLARALVIVALAGVAALEAWAIPFGPVGAVRAVGVLALLGVVHVAGVPAGVPTGVPAAVPAVSPRIRSLLDPVVSWVALGLGIGFGAVVLVLAGVDPLEAVTVPLALTLLGAGAARMRARPALRSWPALGPGLALLLLPSLAFDFTVSPLWRVLALGVVAVSLVVLGALRRLQAPLVLGGVVAIVHAVAQLWPWISVAYSAVPWWLWLGVGGVLLIVLAATYEKRVRDLKSAIVTLGALR